MRVTTWGEYGLIVALHLARRVGEGPVAARELSEQEHLPHDYVEREPWIELVNVRPVTKPAGPPDNPWAKRHDFLHCDELVLHMIDGDRRYKVVANPDKYDAEGNPTDVVGDPNAEVRWYYDADLVK